MDRDRLRACAGHDLIDTAGQLAATHAATHAALLEVLAVIDERALWRADGCCSFTDWIVFRYGTSRKTAHEWADAARSLTDLPHLARAYGDGELSWDKTKAVAALATPDSDEALTLDAKTTDAGRLETAARRARAVSLAEAERRHRARFLALRRSHVLGGVKLSGFLPDVDGEIVIKALERLAEDVPKDADTGLYGSFDERCADALVELASGELAAQQQLYGERAMVVAHVDLAAVGPAGDDPGRAELASQLGLAPETMARLMCDAVIEPVFENAGRPIGLGNKTRHPSQPLRRQLNHRDVGCRFCGCCTTRRVHAHHIVHWPGGPTDPDNLVMLCRFHHRLMHEGGWSIQGNPEGVIEFVKPNGEVLSSAPPELSDRVKKRILEPVLPDG